MHDLQGMHPQRLTCAWGLSLLGVPLATAVPSGAAVTPIPSILCLLPQGPVVIACARRCTCINKGDLHKMLFVDLCRLNSVLFASKDFQMPMLSCTSTNPPKVEHRQQVYWIQQA